MKPGLFRNVNHNFPLLYLLAVEDVINVYISKGNAYVYLGFFYSRTQMA